MKRSVHHHERHGTLPSTGKGELGDSQTWAGHPRWIAGIATILVQRQATHEQSLSSKHGLKPWIENGQHFVHEGNEEGTCYEQKFRRPLVHVVEDLTNTFVDGQRPDDER